MADFQFSVAQALLEIGAVGFLPQQPVRFKSGMLAPVYVDNRRLPYHPAQWHVVIDGFRTLLETQSLQFDVLAGVAVGGVPHSSALAYSLGRPSVFVRMEAKGHGKKQQVEGGDISRRRVLLVEDLVTTGGSSLAGVGALRTAGALVSDLLAIVSYDFAEAAQAFTQARITLHTLTNFSTILEQALDMGLFSSEEFTTIEDWFHDPHSWGRRHGHE